LTPYFWLTGGLLRRIALNWHGMGSRSRDQGAVPAPAAPGAGPVHRQPGIASALLVLLASLLFTGLVLSFDQLRMVQAARSYGPAAVQGVAAWQEMFQIARAKAESGRLTTVNDFFNSRIRFADDIIVWQQNDYWATPLETFAKGAGDCEDFAIAKYLTLLASGIPAKRLRLVYVRAVTRGVDGATKLVPHMVLAYYPKADSEPLILDNLINEIQPASSRSDLRPLFSFNTEGIWEQVGSKSSTVSLDRLSRWRDLLARASREGFL
jgi:predicted transglutaminase-like cysteine proteinase